MRSMPMCAKRHRRSAKHRWPIVRVGAKLVPVLIVSACAARSMLPTSDTVKTPPVLEVRHGLASYYGPGFHGRRTASGLTFDQTDLVAAHPTYPFGTVVRVTNLANRRQIQVLVVDRGPTRAPRAEGVVIDLSSGAARKLGFLRKGRTRVRLEVLRWGPGESVTGGGCLPSVSSYREAAPITTSFAPCVTTTSVVPRPGASGTRA